MKFYIPTSFYLTLSSLLSASDGFYSDCCRTLLTNAHDLIKEKQTTQAIILFQRVLEHPNAEITMILEASKELKSYQLHDQAIIGFRRIIASSAASEHQLLHVGTILLDMKAFDDAKNALSKVLSYPVTKSTRKYIEDLLSKAEE